MSERPSLDERQVMTRDGRHITLREVRFEDAQGMLNYLEIVGGESDFLTFGEGEFGRDLAFEQDFITDIRASSTGLMLVAHDAKNDEIVGCLTFSTGARARMQHSGDLGVSVRQSCWGTGIGRQLMEMLIDWTSRNAIVRKLNLLVRTDNTRAIALYLKLGFEVEGTLRRTVYCNGHYYDDYAMGLWVELGA